ncbi:MAG: hypothetical protein C5B55_01075 [Blastocatellia bacterium]|nr:MAG: hypothetical protein C5B55_01075 [Blastocatellia bacterium]
MEKERRSAPRVRVNLPARWEGVLMRISGSISDLSRTGCFVLTGGEVEVRELIWLEISLPDQEPIQVWAEVVDTAYEIGFAVRFNSCSDEDQERLLRYIDSILASQPSR